VRQEFFAPIGVFGIFVTLGLLIYELFGIKRCQELIKEGEKLEEEMLKNGMEVRGQFTNRGYQFLFVSKPLAAAFIYSAALAAWTYLALYYDHPSRRAVRGREVFIVSFGVIMIYHWWTWKDELCTLIKRPRDRPAEVGVARVPPSHAGSVPERTFENEVPTDSPGSRQAP
jgi:hypothetical protein